MWERRRYTSQAKAEMTHLYSWGGGFFKLPTSSRLTDDENNQVMTVFDEFTWLKISPVYQKCLLTQSRYSERKLMIVLVGFSTKKSSNNDDDYGF